MIRRANGAKDAVAKAIAMVLANNERVVIVSPNSFLARAAYQEMKKIQENIPENFRGYAIALCKSQIFWVRNKNNVYSRSVVRKCTRMVWIPSSWDNPEYQETLDHFSEIIKKNNKAWEENL